MKSSVCALIAVLEFEKMLSETPVSKCGQYLGILKCFSLREVHHKHHCSNFQGRWPDLLSSCIFSQGWMKVCCGNSSVWLCGQNTCFEQDMCQCPRSYCLATGMDEEEAWLLWRGFQGPFKSLYDLLAVDRRQWSSERRH